jgi:hypothetical protein
MQKLFAGYDRYPPNFRVVMPFLVASLVYHQNHIQQHYNGHPILSSPIFTTQKHILKDLQTKLHGGNSLRSLLPLTGRSYLGATFAKVSNIEVLVTAMHHKMFEDPSNSALLNQRESLPVVAAHAPTRCSAAASGGVVVYGRWCMGYGGVWYQRGALRRRQVV